MENKIVMGLVPLHEYSNGQAALARIAALKDLTIRTDFIVSKEEIAAVLDFDLPEEQKDVSV